MKRMIKRKPAKSERPEKTRSKPAVAFRLEQPIQTALYAKLWRLGYEGQPGFF